MRPSHPDGTLIDRVGDAKRSDALAGSLHYTDLQEVPGLSGVNTTVEHVAQHCWQELASAVQERGMSTMRVAVWESEDVGAALDAPLDR